VTVHREQSMKREDQQDATIWVLWQRAMLCNVMLRRVPCYGCALHIRSRALFAT